MSATAQIIPLTVQPNQSFDISLNVDGGVLQLHLAIGFNEMAGYWILGIADQQGNQLLNSIPLVTGSWPAANVLGQYGYLQIGSAFVINASNLSTDLQDYPGQSNLGSDYILLWDNSPGYVAPLAAAA